jgi:hypothetical protein
MTSERNALTREERRALIDLVHWEIENSRFPQSERVQLLKRIRAKLLRAAAKARQESEGTPQQRR